jgi:hypothetical protein
LHPVCQTHRNWQDQSILSFSPRVEQGDRRASVRY